VRAARGILESKSETTNRSSVAPIPRLSNVASRRSLGGAVSNCRPPCSEHREHRHAADLPHDRQTLPTRCPLTAGPVPLRDSSTRPALPEWVLACAGAQRFFLDLRQRTDSRTA